MLNLLQKPIITEKVTKQTDKFNRYAFRVSKDVNKIQIAKAISEMYNVAVIDVNTMIVRGKSKSRYTKTGMVKGSTGSWKKAIVTLKEGDTIDFYANV